MQESLVDLQQFVAQHSTCADDIKKLKDDIKKLQDDNKKSQEDNKKLKDDLTKKIDDLTAAVESSKSCATAECPARRGLITRCKKCIKTM